MPQSRGSRARRGESNVDLVKDVAASYSRYSSDQQDESSIVQQQRKCQEKATGLGHVIKPHLEFADAAVSGTKRERDGLNAMLEAARSGKFRTIYFESLSRLARESIITMPMLKELVYVHRIRVIAVSEGIDSHQNNWELLASFMSWVHEQFLKSLRSAVLRGQEDALLKDWSVGDWCTGYKSEAIPGSEKARRGTHPRPRMRVIIDDEQATWVRQIFSWFVNEHRGLSWIARELTRRGAPKDHRSTTPGWHHSYVRGLLRNEKFIGIWRWGRKTNVRNPMTGTIFHEDRPIEEIAKWVRERSSLRIIDDATFCKAQVKLDENESNLAGWRRDDGKLAGSGRGGNQLRHLLQSMIKCGECGQTFHTGGAFARYLGCYGYKRGLCNCRTRAPRLLAERLILDAIAKRLESDETWIKLVIEEARQAWAVNEKNEPDDRKEIEASLATINQKILRLVDELENRSGPARDDIRMRLDKRDKERRQLEIRLSDFQNRDQRPSEPPTEEWARSKLRAAVEILRAGGSQACRTLKKLVGSIVVTEVEGLGKKRKSLLATFSLFGAAIDDDGIKRPNASLPNSEPITVRIEEAPTWLDIVEDVKRLYDDGLMFREIAEQLHRPVNLVKKMFIYWHRKRGLPLPNVRKRALRNKPPGILERISEPAKRLREQGMPIKEIARQLQCKEGSVTAGIRWWYKSRGLQVPEGGSRALKLGHDRSEAVPSDPLIIATSDPATEDNPPADPPADPERHGEEPCR